MASKANRKIAKIALMGAASVLALAMTPAMAGADQASVKKTAAVLWIGGTHHDFESAAKIIVPALEDRMSIKIPVVRDGSFLDSAGAEQLDVIVMFHCHDSAEGVINEAQKKKLLALVRGGVGVVALHSSYYSFLEWDEVHEFYGAKFIKHGSSKAIVVVRKLDNQHPITSKLEDSFEVMTELYQSTPLAEDCHVLARAKEKAAPDEHPSVWTRMYGQGRIVTILPGHWPESYKVEGFQELIAASTRWAAGRGDPPKVEAKKEIEK